MNTVAAQDSRNAEIATFVSSVPPHWQTMRLSHAARLVTRKAADLDFKVGLEHIESWSGRYISTKTTQFVGEGIAFEAGDVLFGKLRPYLAKVWVADRAGAAVGDFHVYRSSKLHSPFFKYVLLDSVFIALVNSSTYGSKMPRASWDFIGAVKVPLPPLAEQRQIAEYLDRETGQIDALITKQEQLVETLAERRQAVIAHAVTRGLDMNVELKSSGVEWLDEIPIHWRASRLKSIARIVGRIGFRGYTTADMVEEGDGAIALSPSNLKDLAFDLDRCTFISWAKYFESPEIALEQDDILLVKTGSTVGKIAIASFPSSVAITINPQLAVIRAMHCNPKFLLYSMSTIRIESELRSRNAGGSIPTVTQQTIGNVVVCMPSVDEQAQIVDYLESETHGIDALIAKADQVVEVLNERRRALITAAVTGKIDVRAF
ncbi:restriction endonuclease subunit S [Cryobacterium sp. 5B3]|uniref:restriction endonuclease subunit S n=1 Tax=Cryobacterium sp. 5B3 TaxID=3048586 RepID=UPI002AB43F42|nr:restriction endonuclease subunit S [Cryobacterium sp. 5B3]MDY7544614.1 restriction endonuclease subunit S [Cryobacterium sp. 5B3]MEB0276443.1 restriction endonuclease subunit S [Cryobacterium sp. 5B3]